MRRRRLKAATQFKKSLEAKRHRDAWDEDQKLQMNRTDFGKHKVSGQMTSSSDEGAVLLSKGPRRTFRIPITRSGVMYPAGSCYESVSESHLPSFEFSDYTNFTLMARDNLLLGNNIKVAQSDEQHIPLHFASFNFLSILERRRVHFSCTFCRV